MTWSFFLYCYHNDMTEPFASILTAGGHANSLGRASEVIELVLDDPSRLEELYSCIFDDDAWVRMRAIDALEKICRVYPDWIVPYIDRFADELADTTQPSIQWHLAEIYGQVPLTDEQERFAITWLEERLSTIEVDWIVAANSMKTLSGFVKAGKFPREEMADLLKIQRRHKSNAVQKRANKLLEEVS